MEFVTTLLGDGLAFLQLQAVPGRVVFFLASLACVIPLFLNRNFLPKWRPSTFVLVAALIGASFGANQVIGLSFNLEDPVFLVKQTGAQESWRSMLLGQLPMFLAAGTAGPVGGLLSGIAGGIALARLQTHNPFTILEFAFIGMLAGMMFHQPYRTRFFRTIVKPAPAALLLAAVYPLLFLLGGFLWLDLSAEVRLEYAIRLLVPAWGTVALSLVISGLICQAAWPVLRRSWGNQEALVPSPAERSIEVRSFQLMGIVVALLAIVLSVLGWLFAYRASLDLLEDRVSAAASGAAGNVPVLLEVGQNLIQSAAREPRLSASDREAASAVLEEIRRGTLFFQQFVLVYEESGELISSNGVSGFPDDLSAPERAGIELARQGVPFQYYSNVFPSLDKQAVISFIVPVAGADRVLVGRSSLTENPFAQSLVNALKGTGTLGGSGALIDENLTILLHSNEEMIGEPYYNAPASEIGFSRKSSSDGSRVMVLAVDVPDRPWRVLIDLPMRYVQAQALQLAVPLVGLLFALAVISTVLLRFILRIVTGSLRTLAVEAIAIAENPRTLEMPLESSGVDEVGAMRRAFEHMRAALKARMDEQRQLLLASHGAAASLDFGTAVRPLLSAAVSGGADCARVVLREGALGSSAEMRAFGTGPAATALEYLDTQVLKLNSGKTPLVMRTPTAFSGLQIPAGRLVPSAVLAVPLIQENVSYGSLWVAYREPHEITESEIRFLSTLAAQGALAISNSRLFLEAEADRERLDAILSSTPDPVIVSDRTGNLFLANPAACEIFGDALAAGHGRPVAALLDSEPLAKLFVSGRAEMHIEEIETVAGKTYTAKTKAVMLNGREIGMICVLRDVTRYKELDRAKSEVVSQVGHELRAPLQIIRGFAVMLPMLGDMAEEQQHYLEKIVSAVDRMKILITHLLDVGRLESGLNLELMMVSPIEIVKNVTDAYLPLALEKDVNVGVQVEKVVGVLLEADRTFLERALGNLVDNAIKYTEPGGRVTISVEQVESEQSIRFTVSDSGIGISGADLERLFEKFFRSSDRKARRQLGTGLGLAIVKLSVERHHGRIGVESTVGKGSRFFFTLPLSQPKST